MIPIIQKLVKYLTDLENYKISVICDDSGSISNPVKKHKKGQQKNIDLFGN